MNSRRFAATSGSGHYRLPMIQCLRVPGTRSTVAEFGPRSDCTGLPSVRRRPLGRADRQRETGLRNQARPGCRTASLSLYSSRLTHTDTVCGPRSSLSDRYQREPVRRLCTLKPRFESLSSASPRGSSARPGTERASRANAGDVGLASSGSERVGNRILYSGIRFNPKPLSHTDIGPRRAMRSASGGSGTDSRCRPHQDSTRWE